MSLRKVSPKREYRAARLETFGIFAQRLPLLRTRRRCEKYDNAYILRAFHGIVVHYLKLIDCLAGAGGFEPPHGGIKIHCLTTWRRPNNLSGKRRDDSRADSLWQRRSIEGVELFQPARTAIFALIRTRIFSLYNRGIFDLRAGLPPAPNRTARPVPGQGAAPTGS